MAFDKTAYYKPYLPKLEIYDKDGGTLYTYDSFDLANNSIHLEYLDCESSVDSAGTFSLVVNDKDKTVDRRVLGIGNRIKVYKSQDGITWTRIFSGVCRYDEDVRTKGDNLSYLLTGFGSRYFAHERVINFAKSAPRKSVLESTASYLPDVNMQINNLITSLVSSTTSYPVAHPTIAEQGAYDLSGIDARVNNFIPAVYMPYLDGNTAFDQLTQLVGAEWGVDADDRFYLRYPETGADLDTITIKSNPDYTNDDPSLTGYMVSGEQRYGRSMRKEDGFANRLFALSTTKNVTSALAAGTGGSTSLHDRGLAQMVIPGTHKFRDLALSLSKVGAPDTSSDPYLHGKIVIDSGANYPNVAAVVGQFDILLDDIPASSNPSTIYKFNVIYADRAQVQPNMKYWIVLYQVGDLNDENNSVKWYHNNDLQTEGQFSAEKQPGQIGDDASEEIAWEVSDVGPTYSHAAFSTMSHVAVAWDQLSIDRYGLVDGFVNTTAISDFDTLNRYLYAILQFSAKPKLIYTLTNVTMPLGRNIIPGQLVQLVDDTSGLTAQKKRLAEVMGVHYEFGARQGGAQSGAGGAGSASANTPTAAGTNICSVNLLGYYDYTAEESQVFY